FATLQIPNSHTLHFWVHHPQPLMIPSRETAAAQQFSLKRDTTPLTISKVYQLPDLNNVFGIDTVEPMVPGARIELTFMLSELSVGPADQPSPLLASIDELDYDYVGHDHVANMLTTYTVAERIAPIYELVKFRT